MVERESVAGGFIVVALLFKAYGCELIGHFLVLALFEAGPNQITFDLLINACALTGNTEKALAFEQEFSSINPGT